MSKAFVLFGATGDLALRMLFPSLFYLETEGHLAEDLKIVGTARSEMSEAEFIAKVQEAVKLRTGDQYQDEAFDRLKRRLRYVAGDADKSETYVRLSNVLEGVSDRVFYLSTSPAFYEVIAKNLAATGLSHGTARVVVEKPLGKDLASCKETNHALAQAFAEDRTYRIDHYLGKEAVQNLLALRFANALFEPLWNKSAIDHVQISVAETVGVEGRWSYYNDYGAIRDMVQNHLLQLLCMVAMEPPASLAPDAVRNEKVKVLRSLRPITAREVERKTARGQYSAGVADGKTVPGYLEESNGQTSNTETFVAINAHIDNWRWAGVPFYLRTGKRMPERASQIVIQFKPVPHSIFPNQPLLPNRLTIKLQPEEEISLTLMNYTPTPGKAGSNLKPLALNLSLTEAFKGGRPRRRIAYERLILEALKGNPTLFVRRDEVESAWSWIDAIIEGWQATGLAPAAYPAGSFGPSTAFALTERNGHSWFE